MEEPQFEVHSVNPPLIAHILLEAGADVNAQGGWCGNALDTMNGLVQAVSALVTSQSRASTVHSSTSGPKVKEPKTYDGDRSNGKLDDHIRDVTNWVSFYEARGHWTSEREAVEQAATYLTGRMHRIYGLQNATLRTMSEYVNWLKRTFKDNNEQYHLRDDWQATIQGKRTVLEYASDLIYLAARIVPAKSEAEIKDHFRAGLSGRLQMKLAEHPEWDDLSLFPDETPSDFEGSHSLS